MIKKKITLKNVKLALSNLHFDLVYLHLTRLVREARTSSRLVQEKYFELLTTSYVSFSC